MSNAKDRKPAWQVYMETICPKIKRPRRSSLHTICYVCGYDDPISVAEEMRKSGKVYGYRCPDVSCLIFYHESQLGRPTMIDTRDPSVWKKVEPFLKERPYPQYKGFKRFAQATWTGGAYGKGKQIPANSGMSVPYEPDDYPYARAVIKALREAGYTPGISEEDLVTHSPCWDCDHASEFNSGNNESYAIPKAA